MDNIDKFDSDFTTIVHEILHVFSLKGWTFSNMYNRTDGTIINRDNVVIQDNSTFPERVKSPKVLEWARNHFNCPTLDGLALENSGGSGSLGSHWDQYIVGNEIMNPQVNFNTVNSGLTYALLEDIGHYEVDWSFEEYLAWGQNAGCGMFSGKCDQHPQTCKPNTYHCSPDHFSAGFCTRKSFSENCYVFHEIRKGDCRHRVNANGFGGQGEESMYFGPGSRCVEGRIDHSRQSIEQGNCVETKCDTATNSVIFTITGTEVTCAANEKGKKKIFEGNNYIICPDVSKICKAELSCPNDCSSHGRCLANGKCWCYVGFTGEDCSVQNSNDVYNYERPGEQCPAGEVVRNGNCCSESCTHGCSENDSSQCTCPANQLLKDGICCSDKCTEGCLPEDPNSCVSQCPAGEKFLGGWCCSDKCQFGCSATNKEQCTCPAGQILKNGNCCSGKCQHGCSATNPDQCTCPTGQEFLGGRCCSDQCEFSCSDTNPDQCTCPVGQILKNGNCCSDKCQNGCTAGKPDECTCPAGQLFKNGNCCSDQCQFGCSATNPDQCTCPAGQILKNGNCCSDKCQNGCEAGKPDQCTCPAGEKFLQGNCCSDQCEFGCSATNKDECTCGPNQIKKDGNCCNSQCKHGCSATNPDQCNECPLGQLIKNGRCCSDQCSFGCKNKKPDQCICPKGQFLREGNCCNKTCGACSKDDPNVCTKCPENRLLNNGKCCGKGQIIDSDTGKCVRCNTKNRPFFIENEIYCSKCPEGCRTCQNKDKCSRCLKGFYLEGDKCVKNKVAEDCVEGEYFRKGRCLACHESCGKCRGPNANQCLTCRSNYPADQFEVFKGVCRCKKGTFRVDGEKRCDACHDTCTFCTGPGEAQCLVCKDKFSAPYNPDPTRACGKCYPCARNSVGRVQQCLNKVFDPEESDLTDEEVLKERFKIIEDLLPKVPQRNFKKALLRLKLPEEIIKKIQELGDEFLFEKLFKATVSGVDHSHYSVETRVSEDKKSLEVILHFDEDVGKQEVTLEAIQPNYFIENDENGNPVTKSDNNANRLLEEELDENQLLIKQIHDLKLISTKPIKKTIIGYEEPSNSKTENAKLLGVIAKSICLFLLTVGLTVSLARINHWNTDFIPGFFRLSLVFSLIVKVSLIDIDLGYYTQAFFDQLYEIDILMMIGFTDERQVKIPMGGKLDEYMVPVMSLNSILLNMVIYLAVILIDGAILMKIIQKKTRKVAERIQMILMALSITTILFYGQISLRFQSITHNGAIGTISWVITLVMLIHIAYKIYTFIASSLNSTEVPEEWKDSADWLKTKKSQLTPLQRFANHHISLETMEKQKSVRFINLASLIRAVVILSLVAQLQHHNHIMVIGISITQLITAVYTAIGLVKVYQIEKGEKTYISMRLISEALFTLFAVLTLIFLVKGEENNPNNGVMSTLQFVLMATIAGLMLIEGAIFLIPVIAYSTRVTKPEAQTEADHNQQNTENVVKPPVVQILDDNKVYQVSQRDEMDDTTNHEQNHPSSTQIEVKSGATAPQ